MRLLKPAVAAATAALLIPAFATPSLAQNKELKVGVIYDMTGAFAGGGSLPIAVG